MIIAFKIFETWNDNSIDKSLFVSDRAKHNPKVLNGTIEYKTDNGEYVAKIKQIGYSTFLCKVYKLSKDGSKIRVKKKIKNSLKTAHNFIREALNDKIDKKSKHKPKKKEKKKEIKEKDPLDKLFVDSNFQVGSFEKSRKSIIRRFI